MKAVELIMIIFTLLLVFFCVRGAIAISVETNLISAEWDCTKYTDWEVFEAKQTRDCIQYTKKQIEDMK